MRDGGVVCGQLVLKAVRCPVLVTAHAQKPLMAQHARPHDVRAGIVVLGIFHHDARGIDRGADETAGDVVRHADRGLAREEALHDMGDHVGDARRRLVWRQGEGELRVEEGDGGADELTGASALEALGIIADDAGVGRLGAGSGDGLGRKAGISQRKTLQNRMENGSMWGGTVRATISRLRAIIYRIRSPRLRMQM